VRCQADELRSPLVLFDIAERSGRTRPLNRALRDITVEALPELEGYPLRRVDRDTLELDITRGHNINEAFAGLSRNGIEVVSMRNKSNRLEEIFLRLVEEGRDASRTGSS